MLLEETEDKQLQQFEVWYHGWYYAFLVDHHEGKKVVLLTDFYSATERSTENLLLSTLYGKSYAEENPYGYCRTYGNGQYIIINTYLAFCEHAKYLGKELGEFKDIFFDAAVYDLGAAYQVPGKMNQPWIGKNFSFVVFKNVIIAYLSHNKYDYRGLEATV